MRISNVYFTAASQEVEILTNYGVVVIDEEQTVNEILSELSMTATGIMTYHEMDTEWLVELASEAMHGIA